MNKYADKRLPTHGDNQRQNRRRVVMVSSMILALLLTSLVLVALTQAAPLQPDVELAEVDASFWGEAADDEAGWSLSSVGDVNNDGYDDFLIGAYLNDEVITDTGQTYLFLGQPTISWTMDMSLTVDADASFLGEGEDDRSGYSVAGVGDVDNDGYSDFVIGAPENDEGGNDSGQAYLILGQPTSSWTMDMSLATADASFWGENTGDKAGRSVAGIGDVDNDGYDDFLVGAPFNDDNGFEAGQTYLILGQPAINWTRDVTLTANADASFLGEANRNRAGYAVSGAGDVNADGYDDFLIGAPSERNVGQVSRAYLILGRSAADWGMDFDLADADASFIAEGTDEYCGWDLSGAGDVNGDGYDDILVGCWGNGEVFTDTGQTYLILGRPTIGWTTTMSLSQYADASFLGEADPEEEGGEWSGLAVSGAGDVNGDGYDDFVIGSYGNDEPSGSSNRNSGQAYLILGRPAADWGMDFDLANADASYLGESATDWAGNAVSGAGDVNQDGYDDFLVGARGQNLGLADKTGQTYLILGNGLELGKVVSHGSVTAGEVFTYSILYTNTMPIMATNVVITDALPLYTTYESCDGGISCGEASGVVSWTLGNVISQTSGVVTLTVQVNPTLCEDTILTNAAHLSASNTPNVLTAAVTSSAIVTPTASFTSNSPVCLGTATQFTDTSTCAISWSWDFGDGVGTSNVQHPSYLYTGSGSYMVTLTVTNTSGHSDNYQATVVVNPVPTAGFTSDSPVYLGETMQFTNGSSGATSYQWNFGDGQGSTATNPSHDYGAVGSYIVVLTATNASGCFDVYSDTVVVSTLPTASFISNSPVCLGETMEFTNGSSEATSYQWDFGDGEGSTDENPTHDYVTADSYTVVLTATNAGGYDVYSDTVVVNALPTVGFTSNSPVSLGETMVFTNTSTGAVSYQWDFGDGEGSTDENPTHDYATAGSYTAVLTATNASNCFDVYTDTVEVSSQSPAIYIYLPIIVRNFVSP